MKRNPIAILARGLIVVAVAASSPAASAASPGGVLPRARAIDGKAVDWSAPKGGAIVVVFYSTECPISNEYSPTLKALAAALPRSARIVGVSVDYDVPDADLARHAAEHGLDFPIVCDRDGKISARLGAGFTPEAVVLDESGQVRYRGRVDDQFAARGTRNAHPARADLKEAVLAVLDGRDPAVPWPAAVGCPIPERPKGRRPRPRPSPGTSWRSSRGTARPATGRGRSARPGARPRPTRCASASSAWSRRART